MPGKPNPEYAQPDFELKVCLICASALKWKYDKRGRPYVGCGNCQSKIFVHGRIGLTGVKILHDLVMRMGVSRFRQVLTQHVLRAGQKERRRVATPRKAAGHEGGRR